MGMLRRKGGRTVTPRDEQKLQKQVMDTAGYGVTFNSDNVAFVAAINWSNTVSAPRKHHAHVKHGSSTKFRAAI